MIIAFDLGSVIVDVRRAALWETLARPRGEVVRAFFAGDAHERLSKGELSQDEFFLAAARALDVEPSAIGLAWDAQLDVSAAAVRLVSSVSAEVCAWSNTDPAHFAFMQSRLPERLWFRRALSYEVGAWKPEAAFYARALERVGAEPEEVLFLDDRAENVAGARSLGIDAVRVVGVHEARAALASRGLIGGSA